MFEAAERPGGQTWTVAVETERELHHVDTGFIVFNDRNYPGFQPSASGWPRSRPR